MNKKYKLLLKYLPLAIISVVIIVAITTIPTIISSINKHTHNYGEWELFRSPSCANQGIERRSCDCGDSQDRPIDRLEHTQGEWTVDLQENEKRLYCSVCNQVIQTQSLENHTHSFGEWVVEIEATCTQGGIMSRECRCGGKEEKAINPLAHKYGAWTTVKYATCTKKGQEMRTCQCGDKQTRNTALLDHIWSETEITKPATCTEEGIKEYTCAVCKCTYTESIPRKLHQLSNWRIEKEPTCNETGTKSRHCESDNCDYVESNPLPTNNNHKFGEWVVVKEATTTEVGLKEQKCTLCNEIRQEAIPQVDDEIGWDIDEDGILREADYNFSGTITIPTKVTVIKGGAFKYCDKIISIRCNQSLKEISKNAFAYCKNLKEITINKSIQIIGRFAFDNCEKLQTIRYGGTMQEWTALMEKIDWELGISNYKVICSDGTIER